jgi:hypothetical protein
MNYNDSGMEIHRINIMTSKYSDNFILSLEFLNVVLQWRVKAVNSIKFLKSIVKIATEAIHSTSI